MMVWWIGGLVLGGLLNVVEYGDHVIESLC